MVDIRNITVINNKVTVLFVLCILMVAWTLFLTVYCKLEEIGLAFTTQCKC